MSPRGTRIVAVEFTLQAISRPLARAGPKRQAMGLGGAMASGPVAWASGGAGWRGTVRWRRTVRWIGRADVVATGASGVAA